MNASVVDDLLGTRPRSPWRQRLLWLLLALALVALMVLLGRFVNGGAPTRYATVNAGRYDLRAELTGNGMLQSAGRQLIGAGEAGRIAAVLVQVNDPVSKGQLLAQLDRTPFQQDMEQATTLLESRQAALTAAQARVGEQRARVANYQRVRAASGGLAPSDREMALAREDLRRAMATLQSARVEVDAAHTLVAESEARLAATEIRSPSDGVVARRPQPGQEVRGGQNEALFDIAAPYSQLRLEIMLRRAAADALHIGDMAQVTVAPLQGRSFPATIAGLRPAQSADASRVVLVLDVQNPRQELRPGMAAAARIDVGIRRRALVVPDAALRFARGSDASRGLEHANDDAVYVLDPEGAPRRVPVKVEGQSDGRSAVTSDALDPGMPVITGLR